jgi:DNA-binding transcriptional ArsR family regulator
MVTNITQARLFKTLSHPARLAILDCLRDGEQCVCHLEAALGYRQAYISQHLIVLRNAGIVQDRRDGWNIYYQVMQPQVYEIIDAAGLLLTQTREIFRRPVLVDAPPRPCPCPKCNQNHDPSEHSLNN